LRHLRTAHYGGEKFKMYKSLKIIDLYFCVTASKNFFMTLNFSQPTFSVLVKNQASTPPRLTKIVSSLLEASGICLRSIHRNYGIVVSHASAPSQMARSVAYFVN
jgi:hypothetical protein